MGQVKIRVLKSFLGVPEGEVGMMVNKRVNGVIGGAIEVKFDCKSETVLLPYPNGQYQEFEELL